VEYQLRDVALADLVADLRPIVDPLVNARALTLNVCLGGSEGTGSEPHDGQPPVRVRADPDKLRQVFINLLSNAIKFTPPGGRVDLELATRADGSGPAGVAWVRVRDTGQGVPRDKLAAIFEPFVQVRTGGTPSRSRDEGTGLGLAISRDLARGMGGELRARSAPGEGASFTLTLRRAGA
jgi:signal transduction histidine kinase